MADTNGGKVESLPKWAQGYIKSLERERETAVNALFDYTKNQEPSQFYSDSFLRLGQTSMVKQYIQADSVTCEIKGLSVDMRVHDDNSISIMFSEKYGYEAVLVPFASNSFRIKRIKRQ